MYVLRYGTYLSTGILVRSQLGDWICGTRWDTIPVSVVRLNWVCGVLVAYGMQIWSHGCDMDGWIEEGVQLW